MSYDPTHGKSGYIGRLRGSLEAPTEVQFLLDKRTKRERIFQNRQAAIDYLRGIEHFAKDDLLHTIWFTEGEDEQRNLLTGELLNGIENYGELPKASNFWMCGNCGTIYRKVHDPYCPKCEGCDLPDNPDATVEDVINRRPDLLTDRERKEFQEVLSKVR